MDSRHPARQKGVGVLLLTADNIHNTICRRTKAAFVDINLKTFDFGLERAQVA